MIDIALVVVSGLVMLYYLAEFWRHQ